MGLWLSFYGPPGDPRRRLGWRAALAALVLGCLTFPFFLVAGYGRISLLGAALPYASMLSGVTMIAWYAFAAWRWRRGGRALSGNAARLLDIALTGLMLSTVGAWGRAALQASGAGTPLLADLAVQLFLGAFMHGWLILGTLGIAYGCVDVDSVRGSSPMETIRRALPARAALLLGLPGASLSGMIARAGEADGYGVGPTAAGVIGLGTLLFALGLGWHAWRFARIVVARGRRQWLPFAGFLVLVTVAMLALSIPAAAEWGERAGLRILYLHALTLGVSSVGLVTAARERWGSAAAPPPWLFGTAVLLLLVGLLSLSPVWPGTADLRWRLTFAAWTSIPPILVLAKAVLPGGSVPPARDTLQGAGRPARGRN